MNYTTPFSRIRFRSPSGYDIAVILPRLSPRSNIDTVHTYRPNKLTVRTYRTDELTGHTNLTWRT